MPWYRTITVDQWRTLAAAKLGWMLDAMDFMLYAMAIGQLRTYFGFNDATAGMLGTITLLMSGVGGVLFGYLADRLGRTRALMGTIVLFSIASLGAATSQSVLQLLLWRALLGIGMGGEWASGAVLISETWPPEHRNKAISIMQSGWAIGYIAAALMAALILGGPASGPEAWRWLFLVGVLPALFTLWIRRYVREPDAWARRTAAARVRNPFSVIFGPDLRARTLLIILLGASVQFAYWGIFFWLPAFLARPVEQGGAGMGVVGSLGWIIPVQIGAYFGYLTFGFIADRLGRRRTFILFMLVGRDPGADLRPDGAQSADADAARPGPRLLRTRLLQFVWKLHRRALPHCSARDRAGDELQHRTDGGCGGTVHDRRDCNAARDRHRPRAGDNVGVLPARRDADLHAA